jgi:formylglycine-generating enzyme required for sulfatase activity
VHEIWYDQRIFGGQHWWSAIQRRLEWCDVMIYLLSPESAASEYCQREYKIAKELGKPVIPVLINEDTPLSDELREIQYIDLSGELTPESIVDLHNSIYLVEREQMARAEKPASAPAPPPQPDGQAQALDTNAVIDRAAAAMDLGRYDQVVYLLRQALARGVRSRFVDLEEWLREAEVALEQQARLRMIKREYKNISVLVKRNATRQRGCAALAAFLKEVPNFDPENLADICAGRASEPSRPTQPSQRSRGRVPPIDWIAVPSGQLILGAAVSGNGKGAHRETMYVEGYRVTKYPVTNVQFQFFIDDPGGYRDTRWWEFSEAARTWRTQNTQPIAIQHQGEDLPRTHVTWYEAVAFSCWLSERSGQQISLPMRQQWQRAARGDDDRLYPWGNQFDTAMCNTSESRIRRPTLVMRYVSGVSPFGVYDLAGNVWEWCANVGYETPDYAASTQRSVHGGSYISPHERAQIPYSFKLNPEVHHASIGFRLVSR